MLSRLENAFSFFPAKSQPSQSPFARTLLFNLVWTKTDIYRHIQTLSALLQIYISLAKFSLLFSVRMNRLQCPIYAPRCFELFAYISEKMNKYPI